MTSRGTCLNCDARLQGRWCHRCGQRAEAHYRSLRHVLAETIEAFTHADSRVWRTLSRLLLDPAALTRDYIEGRRASEIPPLRLFLVMLLLLFAAGSVFGHTQGLRPLELDQAALARALRTAHVPASLASWLQMHIERAAADPRAFLDVVEEWSERFTFLMLPVGTILLTLIFIADRRRTAYDHVIFTLHSLSFATLVMTVFLLAPNAVGGLALFLLLLMPLHLFAHMRGVYRTGRAGTLVRMTALAIGSLIGIVVLVAGILFAGLELVDG